MFASCRHQGTLFLGYVRIYNGAAFDLYKMSKIVERYCFY